MEWVLAAYIGAAHTVSAPLALVQPARSTSATFEHVTYEGRSFDRPLYYGCRVAFFPSRDSPVGFEGEVIHLKVYARTGNATRVSGTYLGRPVDAVAPIDDIVQRLSISHGLNLLLANVVGRSTIVSRPGGAPRLQVIGRFGAGPTLVHPEATIDGIPSEGYQWGGFAFQASGEMEFRVSNTLALMGEYKFTRSSQSVTVDRGDARATFTSHHGVFGAAWHFG
jgi:hypothetical protein